MWSVIEEKFQYGLQQFVESVLDLQDAYDYQTTAIAFHTGFIYDREWYKRRVWKNAQDALRAEEWTESMIGSGHILSCVSQTMNRKIDGQKNSMLNWRNAAFLQNFFKNQPEESERVIFEIFCGSNEKEAFEAAVELWGATYPVISYLYFLKDRHTFVPARPHLYQERLERLGFTSDCLKECSWDNYLEYLEILKWIQKQLMRRLDDSAELIDAHSFLNLMEIVEDVDPTENSRDILEMDYFDTAVVTGKRDCRKKVYYLSRYEKEPDCHEAAVNMHGYQCMACGFDFAKTYGTLGKNFIEVHHKTPMSRVDEAVQIDPKEDLICLCSNCHRMIHRSKNAVMSLEELKQWLLWGPIWKNEENEKQ